MSGGAAFADASGSRCADGEFVRASERSVTHLALHVQKMNGQKSVRDQNTRTNKTYESVARTTKGTIALYSRNRGLYGPNSLGFRAPWPRNPTTTYSLTATRVLKLGVRLFAVRSHLHL
jgi:hypothetical protein